MRSILIAALTVFSTSTFACEAHAALKGCDLRFKKQKLCAEIEWAKKPEAGVMPGTKDFNSFQLSFHKWGKNPAATPWVDPAADVKVKLWMPEMEHGGPIVKIEKVDTGSYKASDVVFTMEGTWEVEVLLIKDSKLVDSAKLTYKL